MSVGKTLLVVVTGGLLLVGCSSGSAGGEDGGVDGGGEVRRESRELSWDDGRGDSLAPDRAVGNAFAVRFDPPEGSLLEAVRFHLSDMGRQNTPFGVWVLAIGEDGGPGAPLHPLEGGPQTVDPALPANAGLVWVDVDLSELALDVSDGFFVVMEWLTGPGADLMQAQRLMFDLSDPDDKTWMRLDGRWWPMSEVTGFPDGDAIIRARVSVPEGSLAPDRPVLRNVSESCHEMDALRANPGDEGALAVTRFVAPAGGFTVSAVRLQMAHTRSFGGICDVTVPFAVDLYRGTGAFPDADPELVERLPVELAGTRDTPGHQLLLTPSSTVELAPEEPFFVAVHMEGDTDARRTCINVCTRPVNEPSDGWTEQPTPPHTWVPLTDYGVSVDLDIDLLGP